MQSPVADTHAQLGQDREPADLHNDNTPSSPRLPSYTRLGVRVHAVQIPDVIAEMQLWIERRDRTRFIAVTGMHGMTEAQSDPDVKMILNAADLVVPDGMPLVWLARQAGFPLKRRVYGPELMETFIGETGPAFCHFLYGGAPGIADRLADRLRHRHGAQVVGTYCPPFRDLNDEERLAVAEDINACGPDVVWVGLSTPKQERWMFDLRQQLEAPVLVGVGAAFDFLSGTKTMAPRWMQEHGLEWLYRLMREPKRLWRRYIIGGAKFLYLLFREGIDAWRLRRTEH